MTLDTEKEGITDKSPENIRNAMIDGFIDVYKATKKLLNIQESVH